MKKQVFVLGAFDRFNYGDLLFPVIVEQVLTDALPDVEFVSHALVESDLSHYGALPTRPMSELFEPGRVNGSSAVLVAGGGVLGASWASMRRNISRSWFERAILAKLIQRVGEFRFNALYQRKFGSNSAWPWVLAPSDFDVAQPIIYNGVGGSYLARLPTAEREGIIAKLAHSAYLSVRDAETKRVLAPIDADGRVRLVPDSAVVMSKLFPLSRLRRMLSADVSAMLQKQRPFLCFQMAIGHQSERFAEFAEAIDRIASRHGLGVVLLPIGRAQGHEDHVALRRLRKLLHTESYQPPDDIGIYDIMALIAEASLFVGTSLHGAVTAQAFAVPHLGLAGISKLEFYLDTWEVGAQKAVVPVQELVSRAEEVLCVPARDLEENRDRLVSLALDNFQEIAKVLERQRDA